MSSLKCGVIYGRIILEIISRYSFISFRHLIIETAQSFELFRWLIGIEYRVQIFDEICFIKHRAVLFSAEFQELATFLAVPHVVEGKFIGNGGKVIRNVGRY